MCHDRVIKLLIFSFIAGVLLQECHATPHPAGSSISKERKYANQEDDDYFYDDEDEPSREDPDNEVNGAGHNTAMQVLTKNHTVEADLDGTVTLPCRVQHPNNNTIVMWYNFSTLLFVRQSNHTKDPRLSVAKDFSLTITNVLPTDSGVYKCTVMPIVTSVYLTLKVKSSPYNVRITHGNNDYTNRSLEIQQRDRKFIIHCNAEGYPAPAISWSHKGRHLDDHAVKHSDIVIRKEFLEIHEVKAHHAGDYECLAQNGIGEPVSAMVDVLVKANPVIAKHAGYVNTAMGETAELMCLYNSYPEARKIQWFRDDEILRNSAKHSITEDRHNHHQRTRLVVKNVEQSDLVTYYCKIENPMGSTSAKMTLGLLPGAAHLISSNYSNGLLHTTWRLRSAQPLADLQIMYKTDQTKYVKTDATVSENNKDESGDFWTIKRSIRLPEGKWYLISRARNTEGWSHADVDPVPIEIPSEMY